MFSNSSQIVINGGVFNSFDGEVKTPTALDKGLEKLYSEVATGALFNSGERFESPKCHPNTRIAIINEIMAWLNETLAYSSDNDNNGTENGSNNKLSSMWLNGPAGAGKSAIAQTTAQICLEGGQLSSTFFFSRTGEAERRDEKRLIATLAYQILKYIPETQPFISAAISNDPLIFRLSLESQAEALIVTPLLHASRMLEQPLKPKIIIIDGLDECLDTGAQRVIVNVLVKALGRILHNIPHKLLFLSRPEPHLVSIFGERMFRSVFRRLTLDDSWEPDDDIRLFLQENIKDIKMNHPLARLLTHWPSDDDIEELVRRSSGQFVYASTVIRALKSERHHPIEVLKDVLSLRKHSKNRTYVELDALYHHIFSSLEDPDTVLRILRIALARSIQPPIVLRDPLKTAQHLLDLPDGVLEMKLNDLSAVVSITRTVRQTDIKFLHASLPDFLTDESRSGRFFVNSEDICVDLTKLCMDHILKSLCDLSNLLDHRMVADSISIYVLRACFAGPIHFAHHIHDRRLDIHQMLSDLDLASALSLAAESGTFQAPGHLGDITEFIGWGMKEYKEATPTNRDRLSKFVERLQQWIFTRMDQLPLSGFDNDFGLPLTVFAMAPTSLLRSVTSKGVFNTMIDILRDIVQSKSSIVVQIPNELGNELALCWSLMPSLAIFFGDPEFAGEHTITAKMYCDAAVLCFRYLFREGLPLKSKKDEKWVHARHNYLQAMKYATFFLSGAEAREDLYSLSRTLVLAPSENGDISSIEMGNEDCLQSRAFTTIDKLIARFEEKTGGSENPWSCDVTLISGLSIAVSDYLLKKCDSLSLLNGQGDHSPIPTLPQPKAWSPYIFGVHPWTRRPTTMRWFWWNEQNILRWIEPDRSSSVG